MKFWPTIAQCVAEVILSEAAKADLAGIDRFGSAKFGWDVAEDYMLGFHGIFDRLSAFPKSGPIIPGVRPQTRVVSYRSHRVLYSFTDGTVRIVRILHHAMDFVAHLKQ